MEEEEKQEIIKKKFRIITRFFVLTLISILIIFLGNNKYNLSNRSTAERVYVKARIIDVFVNEEETEVEEKKLDDKEKKKEKENEKLEKAETSTRKDVSFEAVITENKVKREVFGRQVLKNIDEDKMVEVNDKVVLSKSQSSEIYNFVNYDKTNLLIIVLVSVLIISAIIGILKSFESAITLLLSILIILLVYIPAIILGANIYFATILLILYLLSSNLILVNGFNKKTFSIIFSNIITLLIIGIIIIILNNIFMINGNLFDDSAIIDSSDENIAFNFKTLAWAGILISTLGVILKISLNIERSIDDMLEEDNKKDFKHIFKTGIDEGRKLISSSMNSLGYAFIGTALLFIVSTMSEFRSYTYLINSEKIIIFFILVFVGILSSLIVIPVTSLIIAIFKTRKGKGEKKFIQKYSEGLSFDFNKKK